MNYVLTPFGLIYAGTAVMTAAVAGAAWTKRAIPGGLELFFLQLSVVIWSTFGAVELSATAPEAKWLWSKVQYVGTATAPALLLLFSFEYGAARRRITWRRVLAIMAIPAATILLAATNESHRLVWTSMTPGPLGSNLVIYGHGPWFWVGLVGYSYLCIFGGAILLVRAAIRLPGFYHWQAASILAGVGVACVGNVVYITGLSPWPGLDVTPVSLALTSMFFAFAIQRFGLLDVLPIARGLLIERMQDGVLVVNRQSRLVDANPAAGGLLGQSLESSMGSHIGDALAAHPQLAEMVQNPTPGPVEVTFAGSDFRFLEVTVSAVRDRMGNPAGNLIVLRDVSARKEAENALQAANERLRSQLQEIESLHATLREEAIRDPLTALYNRRHLDEMLLREIMVAQRRNFPVSVVMLDLDHFKRLNDTHGHDAGDEVLVGLGRMLLSAIRRGDIACRYGGEEFVVILPGADRARAASRANQWRVQFEQVPFGVAGCEIHSTFSAGVAAYPDDGLSPDDVLRAADQALYRAKRLGRNRVERAEEMDSTKQEEGLP